MFSILDGRAKFYQWDLDRKIVVDDESINQVHFCNRTDECSLVCEVYDLDGKRVADVPNVLLQQDWRINVYGYDKNYTKHNEVFDVVRRSKPTDYVYTETEVLNYNTLLERIDAISEDINDTVREYLEENPIEVDLSEYATKEELEAIELTPGPVGPQGEPGYTPVKGVDYFDGKDSTVPGPQGEPGPAGKDGYTPVKGVDYFDGAPGKDGADGKDYVLTDADKQEIANMIDVPGSGGSTGSGEDARIYNFNYNLDDEDRAKIAEILANTNEAWQLSIGGQPVTTIDKNYSGDQLRLTTVSNTGLYSNAVRIYSAGATSSYIEETLSYTMAIAGSGGGGSSWSYTTDIYDSSLYNAKEIYITCMDSNNGYKIFSYVVFSDDDCLGNHAWGDYYTFSVASNAEAAYWQYDGSGISLASTNGNVLIAYKL